MRIQASISSTKQIYNERYYVGYSKREAIKLYKQHFNLVRKRGVIVRITF